MINLLKLRRKLVPGYFTADLRLFTEDREEIEEQLKSNRRFFPHFHIAIAEIQTGWSAHRYCLESYSQDLKRHQNITSKIGEKRTAFTPERAIEICRAENAREVNSMYPKEYGIVHINEDLAFVEMYKGDHIDGL